MRSPASIPAASMLPVRPSPIALRFALAAFLLAGAPGLHAQPDDRIWGRVVTTDGEEHEGFLEFGRGQSAASWWDVLAGSRRIPDENYRAWIQAVHDGRPSLRTVEVRGHRVSWEERHREFADEVSTRIRFGHLAALVRDDDGRMEVVRRAPAETAALDVGGAPRQGSGSVSLSPAGVRVSTAGGEGSGNGMRVRITVDDPIEGEVTVSGRDLARVDFGTAPPGAVPAATRVRGSVEDRFGRTFTGFVSWSGAPVLRSDRILGRDDDGDSRRIPFDEIDAVEARLGGAWVTLASGQGLDLRRPLVSRYEQSDVRWYRRTIRIADPGLGIVEVDWDDFRRLRVHAGSEATGYGDFDGGGPLYGVVADRSGEEAEGWIRWDADEEWTWEHLDGSSDNVEFDVEFANIASIERNGDEGARVTLRDGRSYELSGSNDVDTGNRGIFVFLEAAPAAGDRNGGGTDAPGDRGEWRHVAWEDFREAHFRRPPAGSGS